MKKDMWIEIHVNSALQPRLPRKFFSKHSEYFGRILAVKIWPPTRKLKTHMLIIDDVGLYRPS